MKTLLDNIEKDIKKLRRRATLYTDGGSRGNPGPAAGGAVLYGESKEELARNGMYCEHQTNNYAEYAGLLCGLDLALDNGVTDLEVMLDSELLTKQMNGEYKVKNAGLRPLWERAKALAEQFETISFSHVYRHKNSVADGIVNRILDEHR